jgi:ribonuclease HIII
MESFLSPIFVTTIQLTLAELLKSDLQEMGFDLTKPDHTLFSGKKKGVSCTLYTSGKLVVQGKEKQEFIEFYLEPKILKNFSFSNPEVFLDKTARIGIDESGKGDFFGPLCVAGVFAEGQEIVALKKLGVRDSKEISDKEIFVIAKKIREQFTTHILRINPQKYNELYLKFNHLNHLLAWGHSTVIEALVLKTQCKNVIIDQFAKEFVVETALKKKGLVLNLTQRTKAEEDLVVAAASILARASFLEGLERLGEAYQFSFPKGAGESVLKAGHLLLSRSGESVLREVCKEHFKTLDQILGKKRESKKLF